MIKRFVLVVSVCLTALLISSCSDSGTKSGVHEQAVLTSTECTGEDRGPCASTSSTSSNTSTSSSIESVGEDRDNAGASRSSGRSYGQSGTITVSLSCTPTSIGEGSTSVCNLTLSETATEDIYVTVAISGTAEPDVDHTRDATYTNYFPAGNVHLSRDFTVSAKEDSETEGNETIILDIVEVTGNGVENGNQQVTITITDGATFITVTSPNGGESWATGGTKTISWNSRNVDSVNIYLQEDWSIPGVGNGRRTELTIASSTTNNGSYSWSIPSSVLTGDKYLIFVQQAVDANRASDTSDGYFAITGGQSDPTVSLSCTPGSASESGGVFTCTVSLSHSSTKDITVNMAYSGSATGGTDWNTPNHAFGSLIAGTDHQISAGQTSASWTFSGVSDSVTEGNETIVVDISSVTNGTESGTQRETLTLTEEATSSTPTVTMSCADSGTHNINGIRYRVPTCSFSLSHIVAVNVTISLVYSGTAIAGTDYSSYGSASTTRTINAGQTSTTSGLIKYRPDAGQGNNKTFIVDIGSVTNANESGVQRATLTLSADATTATTTTTTDTTGGGCYGDYVRSYPDLLAAYNASGGGQSIGDWGKSHYEGSGKAEGRTIAAGCSTTTTTTATTTTTTDTTGGGCYGDYVRSYPDLLAAYNASGGGQSIGDWGKSHYEGSGKAEGRTIAAGCSTTTTTTATTTTTTTTTDTTTTTASTDGLPAGDYQYLCKHNECSRKSNRTTRWASKSINVYSAYPGLYSGLQSNWPAVNFNFGVPGGIHLELQDSDYCGVAYPETWTDRTIRGCRVKINIWVREQFCGTTASTVIHEVGHCLGFFEHTSDGGLMDSHANGSTGTNATVRNMISLLYSIPPGTDISGRLRSYSRKGEDTYQSSNPQKEPTKAYYLKFRQ